MSKSLVRSIKNVANGYTHSQVLVRNCTATSSDGPTVSQMEEISRFTFSVVAFKELIDIIDRRLNDKGKYWKHVAHSLTLLHYLVINGSEMVVEWSKNNLYIIKTLREFIYVDEHGHDQGQIIRTKAKELTSLLRDDERLMMERAARGKGSRRRRERSNSYDSELARALEESKALAAEEEEARRRGTSEDDDLQKALQLSREEEELKRAREQEQQNLLDLDDEPQVVNNMSYSIGYVPQTQYVEMDVFGNPMGYQQQVPMATGFLQNAYGSYQQPLPTGSNNPFSTANQNRQADEQRQRELEQQRLEQQRLEQQRLEQQRLEQQRLEQQRLYEQQQQQLLQQQQQAQQPIRQTLTGQQRMNQEHSKLNQLLAEGTGIDTFGNEGDTRIPSHHTGSTPFVISQGTGMKNSNPFFNQDYTGIPSTANMVSQPTGYGFGNVQSPHANGNANSQSLIDL